MFSLRLQERKRGFHGGLHQSVQLSFCIGVLRRRVLRVYSVFFPLSIPYIWCLGVIFNRHHGSGDLHIITIKKVLTVHGSTRFLSRKRISTYRTTSADWGWGLFSCDLGVLDLVGSYMGQYLGAGARWPRHLCGFCCWGVSVSGSLWVGSMGGRQAVELADCFLFFLLLSSMLSLGFVVSWVDGGQPLLASTLISLFSYFSAPVWVYWDCIMDHSYGGEGERLHLFAWLP